MHNSHANAADIEAKHEIDRRISETNRVEDRVRLGGLLVEPFHKEEQAIEIFRGILREDPDCDLAKVWLAYIAIHYLMDSAALADARQMLQSLGESSLFSGLAQMLLAEVRRDLRELDGASEVRLLAESVRLQPDWTENRHRLARAYDDEGRRKEAIREVKTAIANLLKAQPADVFTKYFEVCFTGRLEPRRRLDDYLGKLEGRKAD